MARKVQPTRRLKNVRNDFPAVDADEKPWEPPAPKGVKRWVVKCGNQYFSFFRGNWKGDSTAITKELATRFIKRDAEKAARYANKVTEEHFGTYYIEELK